MELLVKRGFLLRLLWCLAAQQPVDSDAEIGGQSGQKLDIPGSRTAAFPFGAPPGLVTPSEEASSSWADSLFPAEEGGVAVADGAVRQRPCRSPPFMSLCLEYTTPQRWKQWRICWRRSSGSNRGLGGRACRQAGTGKRRGREEEKGGGFLWKSAARCSV